MIVLAIAGLILAIVFIAVPALQRNARDTQRRADISAIQGAIATYSGNNNGQTPTTPAQMIIALDGINLGFYDQAMAAPATASSTPVAKTLVVSAARTRSGALAEPKVLDTAASELLIDGAVLIPEADCDGTGAPVKTTDLKVGWPAILTHGSARSYAIVYALESDPNIICVDNI